MISVIIPTLNAEHPLVSTLQSLLEANARGIIKEVLVVDGGSDDDTQLVAEEAGARVIQSRPGRGQQLAAGAEAARAPWLLFLHADTRLAYGWEDKAVAHMDAAYDRQAAVFKLSFDAEGLLPRLVALGANLRTRFANLPYGDQGLLISRRHYDRLGGFTPMPLFEDVDFVNRLTAEGGSKALAILATTARTSAERYRKNGYIRQVLSNFRCMQMYRAGVPVEQIAERYYGRNGKGVSASACHDGKTAAHGAGQD